MAINPLTYQTPAPFVGDLDFKPLAALGEQYGKWQDQKKLSALGKDLADGNINYQQAAGRAADMGDIGSTLKFLGLSESQKTLARQQEAYKQLASTLPTFTGGSGEDASAAPAAAPAAPSPPIVDRPANAPIETNSDGTIRGNTATMPAPGPGPMATGPSMAPPPAPLGVPAPAPAMTPAPPLDPPARAAPSDTQKKLTYLLQQSINPNLDETARKTMGMLYKQTYDAAQPSEKIQTLQGLRDNPDLLAIEKDLRKSQAPAVNILPGEKKQSEELGKTLGEIHGTYIKEALASGKNKASLDAAERAMSAPGFASGTFAPAVVGAQRALVGLGIGDADKAAPNELFAKLQNRAVMDAGGSSSGLGPQISNNDAKIIRDSTFNQSNTPEGNKMIIGFLRLTEDRKVEFTKELNKFAQKNGGNLTLDVIEHMDNWAKDHPLDFSKVPGLNPAKVKAIRDGTDKSAPADWRSYFGTQ